MRLSRHRISLKGMGMPRRKKLRPTDGELEILRVLWSRGPSTVRQVHQELVADKQTSYNTTLKLLQIMNEKGTVVRDETQRPQVYRPRVPEGKMQQRLVSDLLQRAFGGSARKLVAALTATDISPEERAEIRLLLDELEEKQR
jgi:predicted transcriptional regulator